MPHALSGSGPAVIDVGAGRVDIMFDAPSLLPLIQAGASPLAAARLRATNRAGRADLRRAASRAWTSLWFGLSGPAGLPASVLRRLNTEIEKILQMSDVKEAFARQGAVPMGGPPERYDAFMRAEQARWSDVVRKNNIRVD
jgi:tripartite-type tricarboxylate transporter receptor subunit TctC